MVSKLNACALLNAAASAVTVDKGLSLQLSLNVAGQHESSSPVSLDLALNVDTASDEDCHEWQGQCGVYPDCQPCEVEVAADCALQNLCGDHPNCVECEVEVAADCALQNLCGDHPNCVECEPKDECHLTKTMIIEKLGEASDAFQEEKAEFDELTRALFDSPEYPYESLYSPEGHIVKYGPLWFNCHNKEGWEEAWNLPPGQGLFDPVSEFEIFQKDVRNMYCQDVRDGIWPYPVYSMVPFTSVEPEPQSCAETQEAVEIQRKIFGVYDRELDLSNCNQYVREFDWDSLNV